MFLSGVSTRRVREVIEPLLGDGVSAQTVSRICRSLDAEVQRYHRRNLDDRYRYLLLDGIVLKVKGAAELKRRVVLCAYGITHTGIRELIDFRQAHELLPELSQCGENYLRRHQPYECQLEGNAHNS